MRFRQKRNWAWECRAEVHFNSGNSRMVSAITNDKGKIVGIDLDTFPNDDVDIDGKLRITQANFIRHDIYKISYTTPAEISL